MKRREAQAVMNPRRYFGEDLPKTTTNASGGPQPLS
jgi:hypothetical protein